MADFDAVLRALIEAGALLGFGLVGALLFRKRFQPVWLISAVAVHFLYLFLVTRGFAMAPIWPEGAQWNWSGKAASIAGMLLVAALPFAGWRKAGLTFRQAPGAWLAWAVLAVVVGVAFYFAYTSGDGKPSPAETIAFQWTMPSLDEEIYYRGVMLLFLDRAFAPASRLIGAPLGWGALVSSLMFGLTHGLGVSDGGVSFDAFYFGWTFLLGAFFVWLRARTGSILAPLAGHSFGNGLFTLF